MKAPGTRVDPLLLVLHVGAAVLIMATGAHTTHQVFRATREFPLLPAAVMSLEIALIFQWGLYYATRSDKVRRVLRVVLWLHVICAPALAGLLLAWPELSRGG